MLHQKLRFNLFKYHLINSNFKKLFLISAPWNWKFFNILIFLLKCLDDSNVHFFLRPRRKKKRILVITKISPIKSRSSNYSTKIKIKSTRGWINYIFILLFIRFYKTDIFSRLLYILEKTSSVNLKIDFLTLFIIKKIRTNFLYILKNSPRKSNE